VPVSKDRQPGLGVSGKSDEIGLDWAAASAPSSVMREFARIGVARGLSLGELARRLNKQDGTSLTAVNVSRHFDSASPQISTVESYAKMLGVSKTHLALLQHQSLEDRDVRAALLAGTRILLLRGAEFKKGTVENVSARVAEMVQHPDAEGASIARALMLAEQRERHGTSDENAQAHPAFAARFGLPLTAFAAALLPRTDLFSAALKTSDTRLARVWVELGFLFADEAAQDAEQVVAFIIGLLRRRGIDTSKMEDALEKTRRYLPAALEIPAGLAHATNAEAYSSPGRKKRTQKEGLKKEQ
jgi:hypothetical protein